MLPAENQMKKDITNRVDVELLIDSFYKTVQKDATIGYFFNDIAQIDWNTHLPQMYNFWESIIFAKKVYTGNPMKKTSGASKKIPT
jgi:hemoglobin